MKVIAALYKAIHNKPAPYYLEYPLWLLFWKPIRKYLNVAVIPDIPFNTLRICLYRVIGFKIGKNCFIGMKCYLDDIEPEKTQISNNVTISYGVYFSIHGINQSHQTIKILDNAYIGMRATIVAKNTELVIGKHAIVGAATLVIESVNDSATVVGVPGRQIKQHAHLA